MNLSVKSIIVKIIYTENKGQIINKKTRIPFVIIINLTKKNWRMIKMNKYVSNLNNKSNISDTKNYNKRLL